MSLGISPIESHWFANTTTSQKSGSPDPCEQFQSSNFRYHHVCLTTSDLPGLHHTTTEATSIQARLERRVLVFPITKNTKIVHPNLSAQGVDRTFIQLTGLPSSSHILFQTTISLLISMILAKDRLTEHQMALCYTGQHLTTQ